MKKTLSAIAAAIMAFTFSGEKADAHATSIGFANSGPGTVAVWLGAYNHGASFHRLEGSMNLVGVNGNPFASTTVAFSLTAGAGPIAGWQDQPGYQAGKPTGLIDGTTNFYGCNQGNQPLTNTCTGSGQSFGQPDHWQGALFSGLQAGDYQFTWTPIANPSAEWSLYNSNMNGIFTIDGTVINPNVVPLPAGLPLMAGALSLLGFGAMRKKKKA